MKDLSLFLLKNSLGAKMKKGFRTFCNGDGSTSTLNQHKNNHPILTQSPVDSPSYLENPTLGESSPTLEEMILQLDLEEKMAVRRARLHDDDDDEYGEVQRRMSCVNNSDILRSARNALNQYPRFSLDGKDAMYRSSFRNLPPVGTAGRRSICCNRELRKGLKNPELEKPRFLPPATLAGESVVWCKPGVVAKLMGLEAMPVPVNNKCRRERLSSTIKKQSLRRRTERHDGIERRRHVMNMNGCSGINRGLMGSCSANEYSVMKPVALQTPYDEAGWPIRCFL